MDGGTMSSRKSYGLPENFNPSDHPPVKLRHPHSYVYLYTNFK